MRVFRALGLMVAALAGAAAPLAAQQVRTIDPNSAIDADLRSPAPRATPSPAETREWRDPQETAVDPGPQGDIPPSAYQTQAQSPASGYPATDATAPYPAPERATAAADASTYERDDVLAAAEGVFGKGAEGLASMVEKLLREQGKPNAYIAGREAGGAFVVGARYGSGLMSHRVEGQRKVFWTGPSLGFDVGGDASKVFVLVYNLYDSQEIYKRFPSAEGRVFFIGGFAATYLRRGDVVLIPIRLGVGWRLGANIGYMKFTEKSKWLPF